MISKSRGAALRDPRSRRGRPWRLFVLSHTHARWPSVPRCHKLTANSMRRKRLGREETHAFVRVPDRRPRVVGERRARPVARVATHKRSQARRRAS
jgi:hypothetical protein